MIRHNCYSCHSFDDYPPRASSFLSLKVDRIVETNGIKRKIKVDRDYIENSILYPERDVLEGYRKFEMPTYLGRISEDELAILVDYLSGASFESRK